MNQKIKDKNRDHFNRQFEENMLAIKIINKTLHKKLLDFKPIHFQLGYDNQNNINIKQEGEWLYPTDPKVLCYKQYSKFLRQRVTLGSTVRKDEQ